MLQNTSSSLNLQSNQVEMPLAQNTSSIFMQANLEQPEVEHLKMVPQVQLLDQQSDNIASGHINSSRDAQLQPEPKLPNFDAINENLHIPLAQSQQQQKNSKSISFNQYQGMNTPRTIVGNPMLKQPGTYILTHISFLRD